MFFNPLKHENLIKKILQYVIYVVIISLATFLITITILFSSPILNSQKYCGIADGNSMETNTSHTKLVCYYAFPKSKTDLMPDMIDDLCTHINIAFATINHLNYSLEFPLESIEVLKKISALKTKLKHVKLIISVGGGGSHDFAPMVKKHDNRKMFIRSVVLLLKTYNLDGLDLDWEWPVIDGGQKEKVQFIQLLYEIREEFNRHKKKYILSAAVAAVPSLINVAYYSSYLEKYVDFINVMSYDYHFFTKVYPVTDYNAPLFASPQDKNSYLFNLNVNYSVFYWMSLGMPREKIVLGLPSYGHTYKLWSTTVVGRKAPAQGVGSVGGQGFASYYEICSFLQKPNTIKVLDNDTKVPYAYNFLDWISYDDEESLSFKSNYILEHGLGGGMVWSLNNDDFMGRCSEENIKFPLIRKIRSVFFGNSTSGDT